MLTNVSRRGARFLNGSALTRPLFVLGAAGAMLTPALADPLAPTALPDGGNVVGGSATITHSGSTLNVNQSSDRAVIDWRSFNIGRDANANFYQPGSKSIAVNRVNGSTDPTQIEGGLHANGQVWILNPNGVFFGQSARVDAAGVVASTGNIDTGRFMAGDTRLTVTSADHGEVNNAGRITVAQGGLAAFVAPAVRNSGTIDAKVGKVSLAAGTQFTLDLAGDHLVEIGLGAGKAVVDQSGHIVAEGGTVSLSARAATAAVNSLINVSGIVSASAVQGDGGKISLAGDNINTTATANLSADAGTSGHGGTITAVANNTGTYAGTFSAKGGSVSGDGGHIETSGHDVHIGQGTSVSASATNGKAGSWTVDPGDIDIDAAFASTIQTALAGGTSTEVTAANGTTGNGDVTLSASINAAGTNGADLTITGRHLFATGGNTVNISGAGSSLILNVNAINTVADTTGSGNWVQDALNMIGNVSGGTTINLAQALYAPNITISKSNVTVDGHGTARINVNPGSGQLNAINIAGTTDHVTITGLDIEGEVSGSYLNYAFGAGVSRGVAVAMGATNFTISGNTIANIRTGILVDGRSNTGSITGNTIDNTKGAISVQYTDGTGYDKSVAGSDAVMVSITGNHQGAFGNEWGVNYHLNGYWNGVAGDLLHPNANPVVNGIYLAQAPTLAQQQALLANAAANDGWGVQDQAYHFSNRTQVTVGPAGGQITSSDSNQGSPRARLATIQAAINAVVTGGTIYVKDGTYVIPAGSNYININKSLSLIGDSEANTIIDARNASTYGLRITVGADNVSLSNFTLWGATAANSYGLKAENVQNLVISHVTSRGAAKSEFDFNGVRGGIFDHLTADGRNVTTNVATAGNGISFTDSQNITLTNSVTHDNAWGGLALYQTNSPSGYIYQLTGIRVDGTNTFTEANGIYAEDQSTLNDFGTIDLSGQDLNFVAKASFGVDLAHPDNYTFFQKTQQGAINLAASSTAAALTGTVQGFVNNGLNSVNGSNIFTVGTSTGGIAMSVNAATTAALTGGTVNILAGTYRGQVTIDNKALTITGAGAGATTLEAPDTLNLSFTGNGNPYRAVVAIVNNANVTLSGVTVDGRAVGDANNRLLGIGIHNASASVDGVTITHVRGNPLNGVQAGTGIEGFNDDGVARSISLTNSIINDFQKNAAAFIGGNLTVTVTGNTITGFGNTGLIAQNGIEFFGIGGGLSNGVVTGTISGNTITGVSFNDPNNTNATGILLIGANGTQVTNNSVTGTGTGPATEASLGLYVSGSTGVTASGNTFKNLGTAVDIDAFFGAASNVSVTGGTIQGNDWGIWTDGAVASLSITGVSFSNNTIQYEGTASDLQGVLTNNTFDKSVYTTGGLADGDTIYSLIQAGVDSTTSGATVHIGAGTYREQVVVANKNLTIVGAGTGATTLEAPDTLSHFFLGNGNQYRGVLSIEGDAAHPTTVSVSGLTIDGRSVGDANNRLAGIAIHNANATIDGVAIAHMRGNPLNGVQAGWGVGAFNDDGVSRSITLENSVITDFQKNGAAFQGGNLTVTVTNNTVTGAGNTPQIAQNGIEFFGNAGNGIVTGTISGNTVSGISFAGSVAEASGILVIGADGTVISNNTVTGTGSSGSSAGIAINASHNVTVSGNTLTDLNVGVDIEQDFGPTSGISVTGGTIENSAWGVYADPAITGVSVTGVNFSNNTIQFQGNAADVATVFAGNTFDRSVYSTGGDAIYSLIEDGVSNAADGSTVHIGTGNYTLANELDITKSLTIVGAGVAGTTITSNSTGYGINVTADNVRLSGFTFHGPTAHASSTYGIKVTPDTNSPTDREHNFTIDNVAIVGGWRTGLDLNGVDGASIDNVSVTGILNGNGIALTDSANVTLTNVTTSGNAWGGLALYQTNRYYNQQLTGISVDSTNTFNEDNGVYAEDESASLDMGSLNLAGYNFIVRSPTNPADLFTFFRKTEQDAIDFADNATRNGGHVSFSSANIQGWTGTAADNHFVVGTSTTGDAMSVAAAVSAAQSGALIDVRAGSYVMPNEVDITKSLTLAGAGVGVTTLTSNSTGYGINVTADGVALKNFTFNAPTAHTSSTYGIKVQPDTGAASDRLLSFSIDHVTINGGWRTGLDLNGVVGATVDHVTVTGVQNGNGIALTDSANVTLTNVTTSGNAWGGLALYQTNRFYDQQLTGISVDGTNSFGEANGVYAEDESASLDMGSLSLAGYNYVVRSPNNPADVYTFFQKTEQDAFDFATNAAVNGGHVNLPTAYVEGWTGTGVDNIFTVGHSTGGTALSINAAIAAATNGATINVRSGSYAEDVSSAVALNFNLGAVSVTSFTLGGGTAGSTLNGSLAANSIALNGAITLTGDLTLDTSAANGSVTTAAVNGAHALTISTGLGGATLGAIGATTALTSLSVSGPVTLNGGTYNAGTISLGATTLGADTTLDTSGDDGDISVASVNGAHALTVSTGAGNTTLGATGTATALTALTITGASTLTGGTYNAGSITLGATTLGADTTLDTSAADGAVSIASVNGAHALTVSAGTGNTTLGAVGGTTALASLSVTGSVTLNGGTYNAGSITLGATTLGADTTLDTGAANGAVSVASVDGAHALTISAGTGDTTLGATGATTALTALDITGTSTLIGGTYRAGTITLGGAVTLGADTTLDTSATNGAVTTAAVDGPHSLTITTGTGVTTLGSVGESAPLTTLTATGAVTLTGSEYAAGTISLGTTTLAADATLSGDNVSVASANGAHVLSIVIGTGSATLGSVGANTALTGLVVGGPSTLTGNTYNASSMAFAGPTTLGADATLTGTVVATTFDGAHALTINGTAFLGSIGSTTALTALTVNGSSIVLNGSLYRAGSITLSGPATLNADATLDTSAANGAMSVASVNGAHALTILTGTGNTTLGSVGAATALTSLSISGTSTLGGIYRAGSITLGGAAVLVADTTLNTSAANGSVTTSSINGAHALSVSTGTGNATLGSIGQTTALTALNITGSSTLNGGTYRAASITLGGPATLGADTTLDTSAANGSVTTSSINGARALTISTGTGNATLGSIGATTALTALNVTGSSTLNGGIYRAASITLGAPAVLGADTLLDTSAANGAVTTSSINGAHTLTVSTGTGNATLGSVGATTALTSLTISGTSTLNGTYRAGAITLGGAATLAGDATLDTSAANGAVTTSSINGAHALTVSTGTGNATLGAIGNATGLTALTVSGPATLNGGTYRAASITLGGATTLGADTLLDTSAANGSVTASSINGAHALTVSTGTGNASMGSIGATTALTALTISGTSTLTGGTYRAGSISLGGAATLGVDTTLDTSAANGSVTTSSINGAHALTVSTGTGNATLGSVGAAIALTSLNVTGSSTLNGGTYRAGSINLGGAAVLGADTTLDTSAANGSVTTSSINGAHALTVSTGTGNATLGSIGATTALTSLNVTGSSTLNGGTYRAASITLGGPATLGADTTLDTSAANGSVTTSSINGARALTVSTGTGNATLGSIGATTALTSLNVSGTSTLTGGTYRAGSITLGGAVTMGTDTALDTSAANGAIAVAKIDGAHALTIFTGTGVATIGSVGATTGLTALTVSGPAALNGGTYRAGSITLGGATTLGADTTLDTSATNGAVVASSIDGAHALTVSTGTGNATLGSIGANTALTALNVSGTSTLGGTYRAGSITLGGAAVLGADATLDTSAANGSVTTGSINGAHALTISTGTGNATLGSIGAITALTALNVTGTSTLNGGTYRAGSINLGGTVTLGANTTLDSSSANGAIVTAAVNATTAGGQSLTVNAGTGTATLGNLGATTRLGALTLASNTTLTGSTYRGTSFNAAGNVTLAAASTTIDTTVSASAAGNISVAGSVLGTTNGGQSLTLVAGPGTGNASANGDIALHNVGTAALKLNNLTVSGDDFSAATVNLAGNFTSMLTGNQTFTSSTLNAGGTVNSTVGGNASGPINSGGAINMTVGGSISGAITGTAIDLSANTITGATITGTQSVGLTATTIGTTTITAPLVTADVNGAFSGTVNASNTATINANTITGTFSGGTINLKAGSNVNAGVNATNLAVLSPNGTISGNWLSLVTGGSGTLLVNQEPNLGGDGRIGPKQLVVEGFVLPPGTTLAATGELVLPPGVQIGLLSPGGPGGQPKLILVHSVYRLGQLLAAGYTAIVIDLTPSNDEDKEDLIQVSSL